ncbi:MAG: hypothetical protein LBO06_00690, partial [Bacteroidales bacterium]|nr:hypothetical protein [Bacteroidales bacterium]
MNLKPITLIACLILTLHSLAQPLIKQRDGREPFVDSLMRQMPLKAKVGQLLMIAADSEDNKAKTEKLIRTIDSCQVGGVCFFKGKQSAVLMLTNLISQRPNLPLFYAMDAEWGLGMRMDDGYFFPRALALGALDLRDTTLLYNMGINIAKQCIELGININFAPSLDINLNYLNPIINSRSFGEDKQRVAVLSSYYIKGLQSQGVMAVAKHFPGHGDTEQDSHLDLPLISHSRAFIDSVDAFPFKYNIQRGLWGVMAAHLAIPALSCDSVINEQLRPASLNECVISDYLIKDLQFKGLIFTDGLNMKGITKGYSSGTAA